MNIELLNENHLDALMPLVREYHAFEGVHMSETDRRRTVRGLLGDAALGSIWGIGAADAPIGYIALTWGYSIEFRGRDAFVDEFFISEPQRGRGLGTRVLAEVKARVAAMGIKALHLEVDRGNAAARRVYEKLGFEMRGRYSLMSLKLNPGA
ncbi:MAG TPA: GNAT family N-acetyltransferase [Arenicellales bacterium]|nr:GNAT family N-acetyltransferase [Arenicellales bacterium]